MIGLGTYVSERVQVVVGQFQLLEGDQLPPPVRPRGRRVRVHVEPAGHGGLCLPGHRPELKQQHSQSLHCNTSDWQTYASYQPRRRA